MLPPLTLEQVQEPGSHKAKWNGTLINVIANASIGLTISCQNDCCQKVQFCAAHDRASHRMLYRFNSPDAANVFTTNFQSHQNHNFASATLKEQTANKLDTEDMGWFKLLKGKSGGHGQKEGKNPGTTYQITWKIFFFSRVQGVISAKETHTKHWKLCFWIVCTCPLFSVLIETQPHGSLRILHSAVSNISRQCRESRDTQCLLFLLCSDAQICY